MKVDEARRVLWVCSAALPADTSGASGIFKYDLSTRKLLKKYILEGGSQKHLLNDLVIAPNGDIFATNSETGGVYTISGVKGQLEEFIKSGTFIYPNGITLSADGKKLLVADFGGISSITIQTKKIAALTYPPNTTIAGIDGLYLFNNRLIAVQNGVMPQRIISMQPNQLYSGIDKVEVLEANLPLFEKIPTTGVIAGNDFYFIANSQLRSIDEKGTILPMSELQETVILKLKLP
jgi:DNA-binding beta-propeller fold protein YncE